MNLSLCLSELWQDFSPICFLLDIAFSALCEFQKCSLLATGHHALPKNFLVRILLKPYWIDIGLGQLFPSLILQAMKKKKHSRN